ncbi:MAG: ABC transporter substrate-binding protein [Acidaminococcaceae bacterium]
MFNKKFCIVFFPLTILLLASLLFSGCKDTQQATSNKSEVAYKVTDMTGTTITFKESPKRVVSLNCGVDEILLDLLPPERIAALSARADDPGICAAVDKAKTVKKRVQGKNVEAILSLNPDLVVMPDWIGMDLVNGLRAVGVPVYVFKTPESLADIQENILKIAIVVDAKVQGDEIVSTMQKKLERVQQITKNVPSDKKQTLIPLSLMGSFGGKGTTFDDMCNYANVTNGVSAAGVVKRAAITKEMIVKMDPDVFIIPTWDFEESGKAENFIKEIKSDPALSTVKAIKNDRLVKVHDAYLYAASQYAANAVEEIAQAAYPEYFK